MNQSEILQLLRSRGFKSTAYRQHILDFLVRSQKPVSVHETLEFFSSLNLEPNKTTVYRELSFLIEQQIVVELDLGDNRKRYELAHLDHHHHIICEKCHSIEDVAIDEDLVSIERSIQKQKKFTVTAHTLEFYGLCKNCS